MAYVPRYTNVRYVRTKKKRLTEEEVEKVDSRRTNWRKTRASQSVTHVVRENRRRQRPLVGPERGLVAQPERFVGQLVDKPYPKRRVFVQRLLRPTLVRFHR